jgi:hypothetical protein
VKEACHLGGLNGLRSGDGVGGRGLQVSILI